LDDLLVPEHMKSKMSLLFENKPASRAIVSTEHLDKIRNRGVTRSNQCGMGYTRRYVPLPIERSNAVRDRASVYGAISGKSDFVATLRNSQPPQLPLHDLHGDAGQHLGIRRNTPTTWLFPELADEDSRVLAFRNWIFEQTQ
jgi:hypothetical protein